MKSNQSKASKRKVDLPKEILSSELIKQIARGISTNEEDLPECEAMLAVSSEEVQRVIKRAWKLKLSCERLAKEHGEIELVSSVLQLQRRDPRIQ